MRYKPFLLILFLILLSSFATATDFTQDNALWLLANSTTSENYGVKGSWDGHFNGVDDYVVIEDGSYKDMFGTGTYTYVFNTTINTLETIDWLRQFEDGSNVWKFGLVGTSGDIELYGYSTVYLTGSPMTWTSTGLVVGTEYEIKLIKDGTSYSLYINGVLESTKVATGMDTYTGDFTFGGYDGAGYFDGTASNLKIYDDITETNLVYENTLDQQFTEFDGASYVQSLDSSAYSPVTTGVLDIRFNAIADSTTGAGGRIISKGATSNYEYDCVLSATQISCTTLNLGATTNTISAYTMTTTDVAHNYRFLIDYTGTTQYLYVDDVLRDTDTIVSTMGDGTANLQIGTRGTSYFTGTIYTVNISDGTNIIYQNNMNSFSDWSETIGDIEAINGITTNTDNYDVDGTNDYIQITSTLPTTGILNMHVKPSDLTGSEWWFGHRTSNAAQDRIYMSTIDDDFTFNLGDGTPITDLATVSTSEYKLMSLKYNLTAGTGEAFINGISIGTTTFTPFSPTTFYTLAVLKYTDLSSTSGYANGNFQGFSILPYSYGTTELVELSLLNKSYNPYTEVAPTVSNESVESTLFQEQLSPIAINIPNFISILSADVTFELNDTAGYLTVFSTMDSTTGSDFECQITINDTVAKLKSGTVEAGIKSSFSITTEGSVFENTTYALDYQCKKTGGGTFIVSDTVGIGNLQRDQQGREIKRVHINFTNSTTSSTYSIIHTYNVSTGNLTNAGTLSNLYISDFDTSYINNAGSSEELGIFIEMVGIKNCSASPRNVSSGGLASVSGICRFPDLNETTNYTINVYAKGTSADFIVIIHNKNFFLDDGEHVSFDMTGTNINSSNITKLFEFGINNTNHDNTNLFMKAGIPLKSVLGTGDATFYVRVLNGSYDEQTPSFSRAATIGYGVLNAHYIFENLPIDEYTIEVYGSCDTEDCEIGGGELVAYLTDVKTIVFNQFSVEAQNLNLNTSVIDFEILSSEGISYLDNNGTVTIITRELNLDLTAIKTNYFNQTTTNHDTSENITFDLYNAIVHLDFRHLLSLEQLDEVTLNSTYYNGVFNSSEILLFVDGNYTINASKSGYGWDYQILSLTPLFNDTVTFLLAPVLNLNIFDEKTLELFDVTQPTSITMVTVCRNVSGVFEQNVSSNSFNFTPVCEFRKIRFDVTYGDDAYFRTIPNIEQFDIDNSDLTVWLVDLNTSFVVLTIFNGIDFFATFRDLQIVVTKTINDENFIITGDHVDIEGKLSAYLMQNQEYIVSILSSNLPDRVLGQYFADISRDSSIRLFSIDLDAERELYQSEVTTYTFLLNESGVPRIRSSYNDTTGNNLAGGTFEIRRNDAQGELLFQGTSTESSALFSFVIPDADYADRTYWTGLYLETLDGAEDLYTKVLRGSELIPFPYDFANPWYQQWIFYIVLLVLTFTATKTTGNATFVFVTGVAAFLRIIGWIELGADSEIGLTLLGILGLISITAYFRSADKG